MSNKPKTIDQTNALSVEAVHVLEALTHRQALAALTDSPDPWLRAATKQPQYTVLWLGACSIALGALGRWPFLVGTLEPVSSLGHTRIIWLTWEPVDDKVNGTGRWGFRSSSKLPKRAHLATCRTPAACDCPFGNPIQEATHTVEAAYLGSLGAEHKSPWHGEVARAAYRKFVAATPRRKTTKKSSRRRRPKR